MKVALVRHSYGMGGAEQSVAYLASELGARGHEVHLFAHHIAGNDMHGMVFHRVPVIRGASVLKILSFAFNAASLLKKESFDIVHSFKNMAVVNVDASNGKLAQRLLRLFFDTNNFSILNFRHAKTFWVFDF